MGVPLGVVQSARERSDELTRLTREADAISAAADDRVEIGQPIPPLVIKQILGSHHRVVIRTPHRAVIALGTTPSGSTVTARSGASTAAVVTVVASANELTDRVRRSWILIAAIGAGAVLAAALLAGIQARRLAAPLEDLAVAADRLGQGDFSSRAGASSVPEIDAVARALNVAARRIAGLVGRQRDLASDAAHQLRTPLTALRVRLESAQLRLEQPELQPELEYAVGESDRLTEIIDDLLRVARDGAAGQQVALALGSFAQEHAQRWARAYAVQGRRIDVDVGPALVARASRGAAGQALEVLLENALRHGAGVVRVTGIRTDGGHVALDVHDEGAGVAADARESVFARGVSSAESTGLGLHLARNLVEADGGRLMLTASSTFQMRYAAWVDPSVPGAGLEPARPEDRDF